MKEDFFEVRDARNKAMYRMDDEYLNGYAKLCGIASTAVYCSLCRHADTNQKSFPSIELMAEQHGVDRKTVMRAIKKLQEWQIIAVKKEKDKKTKRQKNNVYILVDKSEWRQKPSPSDTPGAESLLCTDPSPFKGQSRVPQKDCKENTRSTSYSTHIKDTNIRKKSFFSASNKPSKSEIESFILANNYWVDSETFWDYQEEHEWQRKQGNRMVALKSWQGAIRTWHKTQWASEENLIATVSHIAKNWEILYYQYLNAIYEQAYQGENEERAKYAIARAERRLLFDGKSWSLLQLKRQFILPYTTRVANELSIGTQKLLLDMSVWDFLKTKQL